jgi:hypothetical protein
MFPRHTWVCSLCGQGLTRKSSANRHNNNLHSGQAAIVRPYEYIIGRLNGNFHSPKDPLTYRHHENLNGNNNDFTSKVIRYTNNFFSSSDPLDLQRNIIEFFRIVSPYLSPGPYGVLPMNVGFLDGRTTLGFKGYVCDKCFYFWCNQIFDDEKRIFLKSYHTCDPQKLHEADRYTDISGTMHKKRQELISFITVVFNNMITQQELVDLTAVEIPSSEFDNRSDSYEEYVDLDTLPSGTPDWAYGAIKDGKTVINRTELAQFLDIFEATLGFLRLTIDGVEHYFFVYIAKGLEPRNIKYLKKFLDADTLITTGISIAVNNSVINKGWKDMFIDSLLTNIPPLRPDKFNCLSKNPTKFKALNLSENELDDIRERQEYAYKKNLTQTSG